MARQAKIVAPPLISLPGEIAQYYGLEVHILQDITALTWLAQLCAPGTVQPQFGTLIGTLYPGLMSRVLNSEFPHAVVTRATRMTASSKRRWTGPIIDPNTKTVVVEVARGGTRATQICFDLLNRTLSPRSVRRDHITMARATDDDHQVRGADLMGCKIDGSVEGAILLFPDPMGATGNSLEAAIRRYVTTYGRPAKIVTMNLIITPEFIRRLQALAAELGVVIVMYAYRLDRGMSHPRARRARPGLYPIPTMANPGDVFESGLDPRQYIVEGGGDFGGAECGTSI